VFDNADNQLEITGWVGLGVTPAYRFSIGSTDGSDQIGLYHDNTHAVMQWTDGRLYFKTDEGVNTDTVLSILGKGTGRGRLDIGDGGLASGVALALYYKGGSSILKLGNDNTGMTATDGFDLIMDGTGIDVYVWNREAGAMVFGASNAEKMRVGANGNVSVGGVVTPLAKFHADQSSTTAAIPVLYLDQADVSEEMIEFNTTIGEGNAIEAVGSKTLTTTHFIKVTLPGPLTRYIPVGTIA